MGNDRDYSWSFFIKKLVGISYYIFSKYEDKFKMKIAMADNCRGKFTKDLEQYWISKGHEVRFESGASEYLAQWADLYYIDFWDNNIHYLWKLYNGDEDHNRTPDWDNSKKSRIVVRAIDWEIWVGLARDQRIIDWVDDVICIAPHIQAKMERENNWGSKIHLIRPGVNLDKFRLKTRINDGFQLGMVLGDMWWPKNHMAGLDIFTQLHRKDRRWKLHIRGQHEAGDYWPVMYNHYLDSRHIRDSVTLYPQLASMQVFYNQIDILLHPGMKEAFSYATAEAMACGIPPVVNEFFGSRDIWPPAMLYQTHDEAVSQIEMQHEILYEPDAGARAFIEKTYSLKQMTDAVDILLGT